MCAHTQASMSNFNFRTIVEIIKSILIVRQGVNANSLELPQFQCKLKVFFLFMSLLLNGLTR